MEKLGLCLSGGGAKGAYQIGAVQALIDLGIYKKIKAFSGTSIGAANVSMLCSASIDEVRRMWFNIPENPLKEKNADKKKIQDMLHVFQNGLFSMDALDETLKGILNVERIKEKEVFVTASDVGDVNRGFIEFIKSTYNHYTKKDSQVVYIPLNQLNIDEILRAVKASCAIPLVFPGIISEDKKYYDGGLFDSTPIHPLKEVGCDTIILINIALKIKINNTKNKFSDLRIHEIKPSKNVGNVLDFTSEHSKIIYEMGYKDTIEYFQKNPII